MVYGMVEAFAERSKLCLPSLLTHHRKREVKNGLGYNLKAWASSEGLRVEGHKWCTSDKEIPGRFLGAFR